MSETNEQSLGKDSSGACIPNREDVDISPLACAEVFNQLSSQERLYAHYLSKAAWLGSRITQCLISPESPVLVDLIMELYRSCNGRWQELLSQPDDPKTTDALGHTLTYFAFVLYNMGNYYGYGDRKFVPSVPQDFMRNIATKSTDKARDLLLQCIDAMYTSKPSKLGYPSNDRLSAYYLEDGMSITEAEIKAVNDLMSSKGIGHENTRLRRRSDNGSVSFDIMQASVERSETPQYVGKLESGAEVNLVRGSFSEQLSKICALLEKAKNHSANEEQKRMLEEYIRHFQTGDIAHFKEAQKLWLKDEDPNVELIIGFVEQYRDPAEIRAEFESVVALRSAKASTALSELSSRSLEFIRKLPWALGEDMGPFETSKFEPPSFNARHTLAYASTVIFTGINLPNFADIRDAHGCKNLMIINRNSPPNLDKVDYDKVAPFVAKQEAHEYLKHGHSAYMLRITLHELLGHGTGNRLLRQASEGSTAVSNFDAENPPTDPLTGRAIQTWYKDQQSDSSVFGGLTGTLNECRADAIGLYLLSDKDILSIFNYHGPNSKLDSDDLIYYGYLNMIVSGLNGLTSYDPSTEEWSQPHERGYVVIMRALLAAPDFARLEVDESARRVTIKMTRHNLMSQGRKALEHLVLQLHMWRVTANVEAFSNYLLTFSSLDDYWLTVRSIVQGCSLGSWMFVQANTFLSDDGRDALIKEYDSTPEGVIESWAARSAE